MSRRYLIASISTFLLAIVLAISPIAAMTSQAASNGVSPFEVRLIESDSPYSLPKVNTIDDADAPSSSLYGSSRSTLPLRYDLRDRNNVTSVKDQNVFGTCWSFAAIAAFESALLQQGRASAANLDLSEMQLAYFTDWLANESEAEALGAPDQAGEGTELRSGALETGGNALTAAYTMARGTGVITEAEAPYANRSKTLISEMKDDWYGDPQATSEWDPNSMWSLDRSLATKSNFQLHDMGFRNVGYVGLSDGSYEANPAYIDAMKNDLMNNGALAVSLCLDTGRKAGATDRYTNVDTGGRFVNGHFPANHMVTVVGWDDTFSATNFNDRPSGDGAWIVKNSYGSLDSPVGNVYPWGIDNTGYIYVSYYDATISDYSWFTPSTTEQEHELTLQYDLLGFSNGSVVELGNPSRILQANVFTASEDMLLKAVSATAPRNDSNVKTSIYLLDGTSTSPDSGTLVSSESTALDGQFYTQIDLSEPVALRKGQRFSVVQEIASGNKWFASVECGTSNNSYSFSGIRSKVISNPGESFIMQGNTWSEVSSSEIVRPLSNINLAAGNVMIKAFGDPISFPNEDEMPEDDALVNRPSDEATGSDTGSTEPSGPDDARSETDPNAGSGDLSDHPLNVDDKTGTSTSPEGSDGDNAPKSDHPLSDEDGSAYVIENLQPNTTAVGSDPNSTLARTGDPSHIVLLVFSLLNAAASVVFLGIGIRRSAF